MDLSFDMVELGWYWHELRDEQQAIDALNRAIVLRRQVADTDPHDFRAQSELETVLRMAGVIRSQSGFLSEAASFEQQAVAIGTPLHSRNPTNVDETVNLALDCFELGEVYRATAAKEGGATNHNWRDALAQFQESQSLATTIPTPAFDDPSDRERLASLPQRIAECQRHNVSGVEEALR